MAKFSSKKRKSSSFVFDKELLEKFKEACGLVPVSRQLEELMRQWLLSKGREKNG